MESTNLVIIFLTGLTTGGLTCLALQGGLLTSVMANSPSLRGAERRGNPGFSGSLPAGRQGHGRLGDLAMTNNNFLPILSFLSAKLVVHTLLGFLLGLLGSALTLSPITRGWFQVAIGIYLFGVAGNLLNLHPLFRYFIITPPKFLMRLVKNESRSKSIFAPAFLGLMTVFIPCATTQAMAVVAIGTSNPLYGAAIMFAFILGTSPTFMIFGFLLNQSATSFKKYFPTIAGTAMFGMSIYSVNAGAGLMGSPYTIQNFVEAATSESSLRGGTPTWPAGTRRGKSPSTNSVLGNNIQTASITAFNSGYSPRNITLKKGVPAKITISTNAVSSCVRAFSIPALNIQKLLPSTGNTVVEFTPTRTGPLAFSCSMGMYTGRFNIIN